MKRSLPLVTHSELATFRACQRLHFYRYILLRRTLRQTGALRFGQLAHRGLEAWFKTFNRGISIGPSRVEIAAEAMRESMPWDEQFDHEAECALASAIAAIAGYHAMWIDETKLWNVRAIEQVFTAPLTHPDTGYTSRVFAYGGRIDAIVDIPRLETTETWILEHKTTSESIEAGGEYHRRLRMDPQLSGYLLGARALGFSPVGCLYDVIRRPALRPKETESPEDFGERCARDIMSRPEHYYARFEVPRTRSQARAHIEVL